MQNFDFPYSVPVKLHAGPTVLDISAKLTDVLSFSTATILYNVAVLANSGNPQYAPGLYISNGKTWRFIAPFSVLNMSVYRGYEISIYVDLDVNATPAPASFIAFKNGVQTDLPSVINAGDRAVHVTIRAVDASLDENGKIPESELPASFFGGMRWAGLTPPFSGLYDAAQGIDTGTGAQLPAPSSGNVGEYWEVTVAGSQWGFDLLPGDWLVSAETKYQRLSGSSTPVASYTNTGVVQIRQGGGIVIDPNGLIEVDPAQLSGVKTVNTKGPDANGNVQVDIADITNLQALLDSKVKQVNAILPVNGVITLVAIDIGALDVALRGAPNGVASLDANGTVPISELPAAILGALRYQGAYDAENDQPALPTPDSTNIGYYWVVSADGTQHGFDLKIGDWIVSNGTSYDVIDNQNVVSSVNGQIGVVVLKVADIEGAVASVNGVLPNAQGAVVVPFATEFVAGTVKVPSAGGLVIAADGALTISPEIINNIGFTPVRVLYVALNGDPALGNGKVNNPFTTISDAVVAATDGTAIVVRSPGVFNESVTISNKQIALLSETGSAFNHTPVVINGFLSLSGNRPISVQDIGLTWSGPGAAFRVPMVGTPQGFRVSTLVITTSSASQAVQIDQSGGTWTGSLIIDGLYTNDGKIQIDAGYTSIRMMPEDSNSIVEVNGGTVDLLNVWRLQRLEHTAGAVTLDDVRQIGTSAAVAAINSTAPANAANALVLRNVSTWVSPTAQSYVNKTGTCVYMVDGLTRNVANDVWAGTELPIKSSYDRDMIVTRAGVNYSGAVGAYASVHYAGIDTALGLRLQTLTSAGGTSLVENGPQGQLRGVAAGAGMSLGVAGGVVTFTNTGVTALSSVAGTSLVNTTAGQLKAIAAGAGITITETGGVLTFASTATSGVTSFNGLSGAITLAATPGINLTTVGQALTLTNNLTSAGGTSLVNNAAGVLKGVAAGTGITITEAGGVLTFSSTGGGGGVSTFNDATGAIVLQAGLGITLNQSGNTFTVAALGGGSGIQAVTSAGGAGATLVADDGTTTSVAIIKKLIAGTGITLTESATGITLDASEGGVTSVNTLTGDVEIVAGTDISVTIDGNGHISIAYTGSAAGTKVDSINGLFGPLTMESGNSNLVIAAPPERPGVFTLTVEGLLSSIENTVSADPNAIPLIANTGSTTGIAAAKQLIAGANVQLLDDGTTITVNVTGGSGTVKSVNNIEPTDPETGNVALEAGDVGALPTLGGAMEGPIDMASNAIKNLPDPVDGGDPLTLAFFNGGGFIIDNGVI